MFDSKTARRLIAYLPAAVAAFFYCAPLLLAQSTLSVPLEPRVEQIGAMRDLTDPHKAALFFTLFLQVLACVAVAVALMGHWSFPAKPRKPKA